MDHAFDLSPVVTARKESKLVALVKSLGKTVVARKKTALVLLIAIILVSFVGKTLSNRKKAVTSAAAEQQVLSVILNKDYDFPALTNQGKESTSKIKMKISNAEKTDRVLVKDQTYTAKNNKTFLIVNIELKNDASVPLNLVPGDLVRLTYSGDEENKYAPDLHNNLVMVAAISTKPDRIGFVIPKDAKNFKLYVGELEGKKETVSFDFPT